MVYEWSEIEDFVTKYFNNVDVQELSPIIDGTAVRFNKHLELEDKYPLTLIIESFNDKWFKGWDATPEEQRVKFVAMIKRIREHPDFKKNIQHNPDSENKAIAFEKIVTSVMQDIKRQELELYKLYFQDSSFHKSLLNSMSRIVEGDEK